MSNHPDVIVIGAGLAGLAAAWQAAQRGQRVRVIAKGWGATHWQAGCIDVLGYYPLDSPAPVESPAEGVAQLIADQPDHPYARVGLERLAEALEALQSLCARAGYPLHGSLERNWLLPSAVGTFRPTCLAPETMIAGDLRDKAPMLIAGFKQVGDFYANIVADNLAEQGVPARHVTLDLPSLRRRHFTTLTILAEMMETPLLQAELAGALKKELGDARRVGFPAVLGQRRAVWVKEELERVLGRPVFEIPSLTPSVPGIRLHTILKEAVMAAGGRVYDGMEALGADRDGRRITAVYTEAAARRRAHRAGQFILATGGILGGGITTNSDGEVREMVFDLPVTAPASRLDWFHQKFLDRRGHPIYRSGVAIDDQFRPFNGGLESLYDNLYVAGTTLAHSEVIRERSFDGVALATGYVVGRSLVA